jgi:hypothetical protein
MASVRVRPETERVVFRRRLQGARPIVLVLVPLLLLATVALVRASGLPARPLSLLTAGAERLAPAELQTRAADALEQATGATGTGYSFEIVQRSTLVARPDRPPLEAPDPADPQKLVSVPSVALGTYLERGFASPAGFHAEIRRGPDDPTAPLDWDKAPMELAALVRDGTTYRDDGAGWYPTDHPPGLGLDPASAALLPEMLRALADVTDTTDASEPATSPEPGRVEGDPFAALAPAQRLAGATTVADLPGIIAVDLAEATEITEPAELAFDDAGRLVGLRVTARHTNVEAHDLLVDTIITFAYPDTPPPLPEAQPTWVPPTSAPDGEE